ncbi:MAG TPA: VWA domain-containing protein, partial [Victivallales bacterium]|nr:VWA domain-containing protein [Victivallales bacterium]
IDNSPSMQTIFQDGTRLDAAKNKALEIIRSESAKIALYVFNDTLIPLIKLQDSSTISETIIRSIKVSPKSAGPEKLFAAIQSEQSLNSIKTIYFIGDFQKQFYSDNRYLSEYTSFLKGKNIVFVPVDRRKSLLNLAIESVKPVKEGFFPERENTVEVEIKNYSSQPAESIQALLSVNGEKKDVAVMNIPPYEKVKINMTAFFSGSDEYKCEISLPPDLLSIDNNYKFVFSPGQKVNVLSIIRDYKDEEFPPDIFLKSALKAICGENYLNYRTVKKLDLLVENLNTYDMIFIFGIPINKNDNFYDALLEFMKEKKSLICFSDLSEENYFSAFNIEMTAEIKKMNSLDVKRLSGTYFDFMSTEKLDPTTINFFRYACFKNIRDVSNGGRLFINEVDDALMFYKKIGKSNVILAGFMPYKSYTDMFFNPNFVQFTMRLFSESLRKRIFFAFTGLESMKLPVEEDIFIDSDWKIIDSDNNEEKIEAKKDSSGIFLLMKPRLDSGFYKVIADNSKVYSFAYNPSRDDSAIETVSDGITKELSESGISFLVNQDKMAVVNAGTEINKIVIFLLLSIMCFDFYVHFIRKRG